MENCISATQILVLVIFSIGIMLAFAIAFILFFQLYKRRLFLIYERNKQLELQHQEELLQNNILVQEKERHRIAQDLHDEIGSKLNVLKLYLFQLKKRNASQEKFDELIKDMDGILAKTIDTTRSISHELLPPTLDNFGVISAIQELTDDINLHNKNTIGLSINGNEGKRLGSKLAEINVFRIIQELINNSLKQEVSSICINIQMTESELDISFKDDGPGYNPEDPKNKKGMGLRNINNRLKMIGASIENLSALDRCAFYKIKYKLA